MDTSEAPIRIEHREALAYLLTEAAEIEHGLMGCYLYAAWSLGARDVDRPHGEAIERWRKVILEVAFDEMQHLACVANLSNAIGATPHYQRNNYPVAPGYHPAGVVVSLAPFSLSTMEHFVYLERPEGVAEPDGAGYVPPVHYHRGGREDRLVPGAYDYTTVGHLYRGIEMGLQHLADKLGEENLFDGDPRLQIDGKAFGMAAVTPITDLASARIAIEAVVAQGEGAADCPEGSHYMRFVGVRNELRAILAKEPDFDPARGVATNPVMRKPPIAEGRVYIDAEPAASVLDVGNALYAFMLRGLGTLTSPVSLAPSVKSLALQCALQGMRAMSPLSELLATLPASTTRPDLKAGLTFAISRSITPMPEPRAALRSLYENATSVAAGLGTHVVPLAPHMESATKALESLANELGAAAEVAVAPSLDGAAPAKKKLPIAPAEYTPGAIEVVRGEKITILFEGKRCIHTRHCVLQTPGVFLANVKGPWIHPDDAEIEHLVHTAKDCPSGAIRYERHDDGPNEAPPDVNVLRVREAGPYALNATTTLVGHGPLLRATLCRCGASQNKPFCDGSHHVIEFDATGEPKTRESKPLEVRGGELEVRPLEDGPLQISGPLEICSGTGRTVDRLNGVRLCRCGGSANKPFCDGTHAKIGFKSTNEPTLPPGEVSASSPNAARLGAKI